MFTSRTTAPLGSVRSPVKVARASVCANETSGKVTAGQQEQPTASQLVFMSSSSPSRAGVEGCPESAPRDVFSLAESGLRLRRSPGLAAILRRGLPISSPVRGFESANETVVRARQFPPYSRAAATVFHRLPVHGVSVIVNGAPNLRNHRLHAPREILAFAYSSFSVSTYFLIARKARISTLKSDSVPPFVAPASRRRLCLESAELSARKSFS